MDDKRISRQFALLVRRNADMFFDSLFEVIARPLEQTVLEPTDTLVWKGDSAHIGSLLVILGVPRREAADVLQPQVPFQQTEFECHRSPNELTSAGFMRAS